jgi:hypothetical protein
MAGRALGGPWRAERQQGVLEGRAARRAGLPQRARPGGPDASGRLLVTSQRTRDQLRNLEDAREKVRKLVERALKAPRPRRITQPGRAAIERRLRLKRARSALKLSRRVAGDEGP